LYGYSSIGKQGEWDDEEDLVIIMLMVMEKSRRPKHDGHVFDHEVIRTRRKEGHHRLVLFWITFL
jgi:hypothetical protein